MPACHCSSNFDESCAKPFSVDVIACMRSLWAPFVKIVNAQQVRTRFVEHAGREDCASLQDPLY
eukprot:4713098-Amphidinium_carterae.1